MTLAAVLSELEALGNEKMRKQNTKHGATGKQFGVRRGEVRKLAKKIKTNHALALQLWETENLDARFLAILILKPEELTSQQMHNMVKSVQFTEVADWLNSYVVKFHPDNENLRQKWMTETNPMLARAGWNLTKIGVVKTPEKFNLTELLNRLDNEMGNAHPHIQWTMNFVLCEIGIRYEQYRERALAIGEKLGVYSDYPTVKGCTSPFAPIWINSVVSKQAEKNKEA